MADSVKAPSCRQQPQATAAAAAASPTRHGLPLLLGRRDVREQALLLSGCDGIRHVVQSGQVAHPILLQVQHCSDVAVRAGGSGGGSGGGGKVAPARRGAMPIIRACHQLLH